MNRLPLTKRTQIIALLVEGMSMRAVSRVADVSINTVTKQLEEVGAARQGLITASSIACGVWGCGKHHLEYKNAM